LQEEWVRYTERARGIGRRYPAHVGSQRMKIEKQLRKDWGSGSLIGWPMRRKKEIPELRGTTQDRSNSLKVRKILRGGDGAA